MKRHLGSVLLVTLALFSFASVGSATETPPQNPDLNLLLQQIFGPGNSVAQGDLELTPAQPVPAAATYSYCCVESCGCYRTETTKCQQAGGTGFVTEEDCVWNCEFCPGW